jgi:hypothetical protein
MQSVKNIEATEREQHLMREKLANRKNELEKRQQTIENEYQHNLESLKRERQEMKEQIKTELNMQFNDFESKQF